MRSFDGDLIDCSILAARLMENMDESIDPCENFYEFACGSWMKNTRIASNSNALISNSKSILFLLNTGEVESSTHTLHAKMYDAIIGKIDSIAEK